MYHKLKNRGFTLIELLVVIAIIGMLSSVVLANLSSSRSRAKDTLIKEQVQQFANLLALNYSDYGSYCNLQSGWHNFSGTCSTAFSGNYASKARDICTNIYNNAANGWNDPNYRMYVNTAVGCSTTYSIMVYLNNGKWYCSGSNGIKGEYTNYSNSGTGVTPGCYTDL